MYQDKYERHLRTINSIEMRPNHDLATTLYIYFVNLHADTENISYHLQINTNCCVCTYACTCVSLIS